MKVVAFLEAWIMKLSQLLRDKIEATQNQVRKKQTSSYEEIQADKQSSMNAFQQNEGDVQGAAE